VATSTSLMEAVTKAVEGAIGNEMPDQYGLILDGWTHGTEHYLAVFGCFVTDAGPQYPLLSLAPVMDDPDDQLDAEGDNLFYGSAAAQVKFGATLFLGQPVRNLRCG
jgi:hypothetical protein